MKFKSEHYLLLAFCLIAGCYSLSLLTKIKSLLSITLISAIGLLAGVLLVVCFTEYWREG